MRVLGLSGGLLANMQDSAAALVEDGVILAAAEEERFTRAKYGRGVLPELSHEFFYPATTVVFSINCIKT